ncbi:hypothetical protein HAX54_011389 [Datura stramonium]|uniref:Uncharacterized protein n=1 Tax=Datura stramonium TaxID=4076 RepID=A0ABS8THX9_DATST|nr:hypothetical protein [Datura stramonium]
MAIPKSILLVLIIGFMGTLFSIVLATPRTATFSGKGNGNLGPMEKWEQKLDRCASNFGPCDKYCDKECCFTKCRNFYPKLHPEPSCKFFSGMEHLTCICMHDCWLMRAH